MRYGGKVCRFTEPEKSEACVCSSKIRKIAYENSFCLCVYQYNEALSGGNSADTDNDFS